MRNWLRSSLLSAALLLGISMTALAQVQRFEDPALDARYREFIHSIRCMKCQNQSIADSPVDVAADLRREVREMMAEGQSDDEIRTFLISRYGDFISYQPPFKPSTWLLWAGPGILLLGGGFVFARILRERMQQPLDEEEA
jgi:cytochrome c-type biogenesis protein CcmH